MTKKLRIEGLLKAGGVEWVLLEQAPVEEDTDPEDVQNAIDQVKELIKNVYTNDTNGHLSFHNSVIDIKSFASFRIHVVEN